MKQKGKRRNKDDGILSPYRLFQYKVIYIVNYKRKTQYKQNSRKKMKTSIYYFVLNDETISIKMLRKTKEELTAYKEALHAEKVYITINGTNLFFEL